jgi:DNA-binding PadR family transcriptional regulator
MFSPLILGLLRDGRSRHGYQLMTGYAARSGNKTSAGSFYRELARLVSDGYLEMDVNPPEADPRRIPYRIEARGRAAFDRWLAAPSMDDADFALWLIFCDVAPPDTRARVLDRREEELWMQSKKLARSRDDALSSPPTGSAWDPLPRVLSRQMKLVAAELEFLKEFRADFEVWRQVAPSRADDSVDTQRTPKRRRGGSES